MQVIYAVLHCLQLLGASIFGLALWMKLEPGFGEWVEKLELHEYYAGIYVLIAAAVLIIIVSFLGCLSAFMEDRRMLAIVRNYITIYYTGVSTREISCETFCILKYNMDWQLLGCVSVNLRITDLNDKHY